MAWYEVTWVIEHIGNAIGASNMEPVAMHPESIDPPWFQELVRKAWEKEMYRHMKLGCNPDESLERAMWYVFNLRNSLTELYQAAMDDTEY